VLGDPVAWPGDWGRRFTLFVDVEEEFDWSAPFSRAARSVTAIPALLPFAEQLAGRGVGATYMIDHPVATDPVAAAMMRQIAGLPGAAIGTQLHPWVNPPYDEPLSPRTSFVGTLPEAIEAAKLDALTAAIELAVGVRPVAFRAGRYGIGSNTARLLAARGYRLDTSIRAGFDYRAEGGPDFRRIGNTPRRLAGTLIELPLTTVFTGRLRHLPILSDLAGTLPPLRGALARTGLLSRVPLTPEGVPLAEALEAIRCAVGDGLAVLNLSFHSPSLVPGHTPYVRDQADLARFHAWWNAVFSLLDRLGVRPASLAELLAACGPAPASATA
jgi:hypothetical protein